MNGDAGEIKDALARRLAGLSQERRDAIAALLRRNTPQVSRILPRDRAQDPPPLSFAQQRLWFLDRLVPGNAVYNESSAVELGGAIDVAALERALNEIVRRHEALRTSFPEVDGKPVQAVSPSLLLKLPLIDLSELLCEQREAEARRLTLEEAVSAFDLARGPLIRARLLRLGQDRYTLLLTMHHVVCDEWSGRVLARELTAHYEAFASGRRTSLPELPVQYADFAVWQRERLQGATLEKLLKYWKEQLADLPMLRLPRDRPRPPVPSYTGRRRFLHIPQSLHASLKALSLQEGVTMFMTLLAAFSVLLHRYSEQDDIAVGVPVANRNWKELEGLIGFFVNVLVMRTDLSGDPSFREALARVRSTALAAYEHQDLPFEKLVEELHPDRDPARNPLFEVIFQLFSPEPDDRGADPDESPTNEVETGTTKFDLRCDLVETADGIRGFLEYSTDLLDDETIDAMAGHFEILLRSIVTAPSKPISHLDLLTGRERHQLLQEWNRTATEYPRHRCVHSLFEQQSAATPGRVAVVSDEGALTYADLNRRANRLAHYLRRSGLRPGSMVGISIPRSLDTIAGLLAILKAGGAYLPLDATYPRERIAFLVADAECPIVLTRGGELAWLAETGVRLLALDDTDAELAAESTADPENRNRPEDPVYVMHTSGSTGQPKGVVVPHRAIVRLVKNTNFFDVRENDVFLQFGPLSFDASTFEIWGALLNGARVALHAPGLPSIEELADTIERHGVTTTFLTASLFNQVVDAHVDKLRSVRQLLAGGDVLSPRHVQRCLDALPSCRVINGYGPTENTTFTCTFAMQHGDRLAGSVPIGTPIANTRVYVLDPHMQPVPVGVPGELYAGGDGLGLSYLNSPQLTLERFVPDPFGAPGERLYRTGDLVRYRRSGDIEFLGRMDMQVKVRGFRVELGEIEAVLARHDAVKESVTVVREPEPGDKRLFSFVVIRPGAAATGAELRRYLQARLPEFMVPSSIMTLPALPLNGSGKVQRDKLPRLDAQRPVLEQPFAPVRNELERRIAAIWQEVLGLEKLGVHDNFFELGGHSLLLARLHTRLRETVRTRVSMVDLFRYPTVASLARWLIEQGESGDVLTAVSGG
jgi:aspartate racemase